MVNPTQPAAVRPDRRRLRTRNALLRAGETLFAARAVDAVSIDDIVQAADVAKGSFYNHFPHRDGLAREIARQIRATIESEVEAANAGVAEADRRVARALCVFVRYGCGNPDRIRAQFHLLNGATLVDTPMNRGVRHDVEAGFEQGLFHDMSLDAAVLMIMGAVQIAMQRALEPANPLPVQALCRDLALGLLRGLGLAPERAAAVAAAAVRDILGEGDPQP